MLRYGRHSHGGECDAIAHAHTRVHTHAQSYSQANANTNAYTRPVLPELHDSGRVRRP